MSQEENKITVPVPRPFTRAPIPPSVRQRDRKKDYRRNEKHRNQDKQDA